MIDSSLDQLVNIVYKLLRKLNGYEPQSNASDPKFLAEVQKMGAITPFSMASQFNLRLSVAKDLLEDLEKKRLVRLVGGNARIRIYQPAAA